MKLARTNFLECDAKTNPTTTKAQQKSNLLLIILELERRSAVINVQDVYGNLEDIKE